MDQVTAELELATASDFDLAQAGMELRLDGTVRFGDTAQALLVMAQVRSNKELNDHQLVAAARNAPELVDMQDRTIAENA